MDSENLGKKLDELGAKKADTVRKLKALDADHKAAYQAAASDPEAADEKLQKIRQEISHHQDLSSGINDAMKELGGQVVDQRLKNFKPLKDKLEYDIRHYEIEAGRHIAIGLAYLVALGGAPENEVKKALKMRHPNISYGTVRASDELQKNPIASLVSAKQEVEALRQQLSGVSNRNHLIQKVIGPYIRKYR